MPTASFHVDVCCSVARGPQHRSLKRHCLLSVDLSSHPHLKMRFLCWLWRMGTRRDVLRYVWNFRFAECTSIWSVRQCLTSEEFCRQGNLHRSPQMRCRASLVSVRCDDDSQDSTRNRDSRGSRLSEMSCHGCHITAGWGQRYSHQVCHHCRWNQHPTAHSLF